MKSYAVDPGRVGQARQAVVGDDGKPLTQAAAAEALGIHAVTLNRIENGKARVSLELLERIAALTGRSREWLLGEPEQVDDFELAREKLARSMSHMSEAFALFEDLLGELREARDGEVVRS